MIAGPFLDPSPSGAGRAGLDPEAVLPYGFPPVPDPSPLAEGCVDLPPTGQGARVAGAECPGLRGDGPGRRRLRPSHPGRAFNPGDPSSTALAEFPLDLALDLGDLGVGGHPRGTPEGLA